MNDPDLIDAWLANLQHNKGRAAATADKYRLSLTRLSTWLATSGRSLLTADRAALEEFTGIQAHKDGLTRRSRRPVVAAVRGFYAWARKQHLVPADPAAGLEYPKAGKRLPIPMGLQHVEKLLLQPDIETFMGLRDAALLSVLVGCGLRISGLCGLNESSLTFVHHEGEDCLVLKVKEKGAVERLVPAPMEVRLLLRAYLNHPELQAVDRTLEDGDKVLFISLRNRTVPPHEYVGEHRRLSPRSVNDMIEAYGKRAGIPRNELHAHALRHTYGTQLVEGDVDIRVVQALMGHVDISTTTTYTKLALKKLMQTVDRSNPFRDIRTPITDLVRELRKQKGH